MEEFLLLNISAFGVAFFLYRKHPNKVDRIYFEKGFDNEEIWNSLLETLIEKKIVNIFYTGKNGKPRYRLTEEGFRTIENLEKAAAKNREQFTREIKYNPATLPQAEIFYSVDVISELPIIEDFSKAFNFSFPTIYSNESERSKLKMFFSPIDDFALSGASVAKSGNLSNFETANNLERVISKLELSENKESSKKW